jgi:hypothetical protein
MDIEQLKLVLEMVGTATEGAMWFAFAWLAKGAFVDFAWWSLVGYATYKLASIVSNSLECDRKAKELDSSARVLVVAMRDADPSISASLKYGSVTVTDECTIKNTHRRGCEAIMAERNGE